MRPAHPTGPPAAPSAPRAGDTLPVAALIEPGRRSQAVIAALEALAAERAVSSTLFALAPHAEELRCGSVSAGPLNEAIDETAAAEVRDAELALHHSVPVAALRVLREGEDPPIAQWVAENGFALVLLPSRRRLRRGAHHPAAAGLRALPGVEVRIVTPA